MRRIGQLSVLFCIVLLSGCANSMFYYPTRKAYGTPESRRLPYEEVAFKSTDGTVLSGWFIPAVGKSHGTVIHFHGNAQNMGAHFSFVSWLPREGFNIFVFDYRGYGKSEGKPNRNGIYEDCVAALTYVSRRADVDPSRLFVLGQSLGGANALAVMGRGHGRHIKAVAIDSSFYSYRLIVRDKIKQIPLLSLLRWPLSFLVVSNRKSGGPVIDNISPIPLLILHGTADGVIPYRHGKKLFAKAGEPKTFIPVPQGRHTDAFTRRDPIYRKKLVEFYLKSME